MARAPKRDEDEDVAHIVGSTEQAQQKLQQLQDQLRDAVKQQQQQPSAGGDTGGSTPSRPGTQKSVKAANESQHSGARGKKGAVAAEDASDQNAAGKARVLSPGTHGGSKTNSTPSTTSAGGDADADKHDATPSTYYIFRDEHGTQNVVDNIERIPAKFRDKARTITLGKSGPPEVGSLAPASSTTVAGQSAASTANAGDRLAGSAPLATLPVKATTGLGAQDFLAQTQKQLRDAGIPIVAVIGGVVALLALAIAVRQIRGMLIKLALSLALMGFVSIGYMSWLKDKAGAVAGKAGGGTGALQVMNPATILQNTQHAADEVQRHMDEQVRTLENIDGLGQTK